MISTLERHGISFGGNLNAYTTQNETVYNISDVPMADESLTDTCLLILHDWSYYLTLDPKDIDEERGVITEEWRTRNTSATRIYNQKRPILYKGSKYAERDVIGNLDVIRTFKPETLRDFYHKWYRTDLEAIAIVGDFDIKNMEGKIKKVFSSIPVIPNPEPRPFFWKSRPMTKLISAWPPTRKLLHPTYKLSASSATKNTTARDMPRIRT